MGAQDRQAVYREILQLKGQLHWNGDPDEEALALVQRWWSCVAASDWLGARVLLHDDATMHWVTSAEHFDDADAIVRVNEIYPSGWELTLQEVAVLADGRVHAVVEVRQDGQRFSGHSRAVVDAGKIRSFTEWWATHDSPPAWRTAETIGAYRRES